VPAKTRKSPNIFGARPALFNVQREVPIDRDAFFRGGAGFSRLQPAAPVLQPAHCSGPISTACPGRSGGPRGKRGAGACAASAQVSAPLPTRIFNDVQRVFQQMPKRQTARLRHE
jgi:hypothetical protein